MEEGRGDEDSPHSHSLYTLTPTRPHTTHFKVSQCQVLKEVGGVRGGA